MKVRYHQAALEECGAVAEDSILILAVAHARRAAGYWLGTEYAPGYSDGGFRLVRVGMSEAEVRSLLGEPLDKGRVEAEDPHRVTWRYARPIHDQSYHIRAVLFRDGRVAEKFAEFYVD